jgi:large-conductance mechanosensitive channel
MFNDFNEFKLYIDKKDILTTSISFVMGNIISDIVKKIADEIISPLGRGEFHKLKTISLREYFFLISNFIITSYMLFKILKIVKGVDNMY